MILQIGSADVSDYVTRGYVVDITPIYEGNTFTAVDGTEYRNKIGERVHIRTELGAVPSGLAAVVTTECRNATVSVTFAAPAIQTATFSQPSVSAELLLEDEAWDISIDMEANVPGGV